MIVIVAPKIFSENFNGLTIYPFVFVRNRALKKDEVLLNHEKIHLQQQKELLWLPFFIWYGLEFLVNWFRYKNTLMAYRNISFEKEAYNHESDLAYLGQRKFLAFSKYLKN